MNNALLRVNAEFQRNLWEEISVGRLILMPLIVGLIATLTWHFTPRGGSAVPAIMAAAIGFLTILWGSRMASDSITEEVASHTWDLHRLSAQSATSLTLGKFAGGTVYSWYGAAWAAGIAYYADPAGMKVVGQWCMAGLIAQAAAFFTALALRGGNSSRRVQNLMAQLVGLAAAVTVRNLPAELTSVGENVMWFGKSYPSADFINILSLVAVAWLLIGSMRIVRRDLGSRDGPLAWIAFTMCLAVFMAGFAPPFAAAFANVSMPRDPDQTRKILYVAATAFYVALLGNPGTYNRLARLQRRLAVGDLRHAWSDLLPWMAGYGLCVAAAVYTAVTSSPDALFSLAALGFMLRDAIVVTGLRLRDHGRGSAVIFYFLLVGLAGPYVLWNRGLLEIFLPTPDGTLSAVFAWGEALAVLALFAGSFRSLAKSGRPAGADIL